MDIVTYAILMKKLKSSLTGVQSIKQEDNKLVITTNDGTKFSITISSPFTPLLKTKLESFSDDLSKITIDDNNYLYVDGEKFAKISDIELLENKVNELEEKIKDLELGENSTCDWTTNIACGGLAKGTDLTDKTIKEVLKAMTVTYILPNCTVVFSNTNSLIKKSTSINVTVTSKSFVKGTNNISKIEFYKGNTLANTQTYTTNTNYTYTINDINTDTTLKVRIYDTEDKYKDVSTKSYKFVYPSYKAIVSVSSIPSASELATLIATTNNEFLLDKKDYTWSGLTMTNKRACYAYPKSYGALSSIKDQNNFDNTETFTKLEAKIDGVDYILYIMTNTASAKDGKLIFS